MVGPPRPHWVRGTTVRRTKRAIQVALFDLDNNYLGVFLFEETQAGKLMMKLGRHVKEDPDAVQGGQE